MKKTLRNKFVAGSLFTIAVLLFACKDKTMSKYTYTANVPIYMSFEDLRSSVKTENPKNLNEPGKIFHSGNYIFVSEYLKGVHVIDNTNPTSPQNVTFISLPGNVDIAINGNTLYADSYTDLVALDISDMNNIHEISRSNFAFYPTLPPYDERFMIDGYDQSKGVVIGWKVETKTVEGDGYYGGPMMGWKTNEVPVQGKAGSTSRFALKNNFLYATDSWSMKIYNVSNSTALVESPAVYLMGNAETIFPTNDKLFIGTQTGMLIYDITNDGNPNYEGIFNHGRGCDPVIVEGNKAYVTLRSGGPCGDIKNELHVVNISDPVNPVLEQSYPMQEPRGLAIENQTLYVCDGASGLKIYNANNPSALSQLTNVIGYNTHDIILYDNNMMVVGPTGLEQFDRSNSAQPLHLSTIPVYSTSAK